jgi:phospholipid/cholesterol/gamma-HCH transport system ATP-binding protein
VITLRDVHKAFGDQQVLRGLTFEVPQGRTYVIMGRSGSGKSVTLKHIVGILKPDRGEVLVDGQRVDQLDRQGLMALRKKIGFLFQNGALINWLTVFENVALPLREHARLPKDELEQRVREALEVVEMHQAAEQVPAQISGGMKLRTGIARALVARPTYVLYDEPNAGLDPIIADQIHRLIVDVRDRFGVTGIVVTHSRACARSVGDRIGLFDQGRIVVEGSVEEMMASDHELVRSFLGTASDSD